MTKKSLKKGLFVKVVGKLKETSRQCDAQWPAFPTLRREGLREGKWQALGLWLSTRLLALGTPPNLLPPALPPTSCQGSYWQNPTDTKRARMPPDAVHKVGLPDTEQGGGRGVGVVDTGSTWV